MHAKDFYSDMAIEFYKHSYSSDDGVVRLYEAVVDGEMSAKLRKPSGRYATVETAAVLNGDTDKYSRISDALSRTLSNYLGGAGRVLVAGLGNPDLTADALGDRVFKRIDVKRREDGESGYLCALTPNVLGMTGIESFDIIAAVTDRIRPDAVIAVDALTAAAVGRIASAFQITDSGITPGSGVDNYRARLSKDSLGVPVVSIGVPLVVYASTIVRESCPEKSCRDRDMIVTPKDVDILVEDCAGIIAAAINSAISIKR